MAYLRMSIYCAVILLAGPTFMCCAAQNESQPLMQNKITARSVWVPSQESVKILKQAESKKEGSQQLLQSIMKADHASGESVAFASLFSTEPAYLCAITPPSYSDGFAVGEIRFPFRPENSRSFVVLNANPKVINVSDLQYRKSIDITSSRDFAELGIPKSQAECLWDEPSAYEVQPGVKDHTNVQVSFPIRDSAKGPVIGKAYVVFEFSFPGRKLLKTRLDFIEKLQ